MLNFIVCISHILTPSLAWCALLVVKSRKGWTWDRGGCHTCNFMSVFHTCKVNPPPPIHPPDVIHMVFEANLSLLFFHILLPLPTKEVICRSKADYWDQLVLPLIHCTLYVETLCLRLLLIHVCSCSTETGWWEQRGTWLWKLGGNKASKVSVLEVQTLMVWVSVTMKTEGQPPHK